MAAPESDSSAADNARSGTSDEPVDVFAAAGLKPLDVDGVGVCVTGTVLWALAGLLLAVFFRHQLDEAGRIWWIQTCAVGAALGLLGLPYLLRRRSTYRRRAIAAGSGNA